MRGIAIVAALALAATAGAGRARAASEGCAATAPATASPTHPGTGTLVPHGANSLLLCRYRGLNPASTAHRLARARRVTATSELARLTGELDALPNAGNLVHCPMDDGSEITATFSYPRAASVVVTVDLTGCRTVGNGRVTRTAASAAGGRLIDQLTALVP
jgi:hypothetical protein